LNTHHVGDEFEASHQLVNVVFQQLTYRVRATCFLTWFDRLHVNQGVVIFEVHDALS